MLEFMRRNVIKWLKRIKYIKKIQINEQRLLEEVGLQIVKIQENSFFYEIAILEGTTFTEIKWMPIIVKDKEEGIYILTDKIYYKKDKNTSLKQIFNHMYDIIKYKLTDFNCIIIVRNIDCTMNMISLKKGEVKELLASNVIEMNQDGEIITVIDTNSEGSNYYRLEEDTLIPMGEVRVDGLLEPNKLCIRYLNEEKMEALLYWKESEIKTLAVYSNIKEISNGRYAGKNKENPNKLVLILCKKEKAEYNITTIKLEGDKIKKFEIPTTNKDYETYKVYSEEGVNFIVLEKDKIVFEKFYLDALDIRLEFIFTENKPEYKLKPMY